MERKKIVVIEDDAALRYKFVKDHDTSLILFFFDDINEAYQVELDSLYGKIYKLDSRRPDGGMMEAMEKVKDADFFFVDGLDGYYLLVEKVRESLGIPFSKFYMTSDNLDYCKEMKQRGWELGCRDGINLEDAIGK